MTSQTAPGGAEALMKVAPRIVGPPSSVLSRESPMGVERSEAPWAVGCKREGTEKRQKAAWSQVLSKDITKTMQQGMSVRKPQPTQAPDQSG